NVLNLALETPEDVRLKTDNLNVGYQTDNKTWELIAKYHGSLDFLIPLGVLVEYLIPGYCILTVPQDLVETISGYEEIEYIEKPKRYYYMIEDAKTASCISSVETREPFLTGEGVLVAVLDSGIEYTRVDFRRADGSTRIRYLWDQTLTPTDNMRPPQGYGIGVEFSQDQINDALQQEDAALRAQIVPSMDANGHGTAVAGIAAGGESACGRYQGVAFESELLIVKLGIAPADGFPRTTQIMRGVTYAVNKAIEIGMPLVINLSFGNSYGAHDGSSLLERFLDNAAEIGRTVICVGSGNEGNSAGHMAGNVADNQVVEFAIGSYETTLSVQLWKHYCDVYRISLRSPGGLQEPLTGVVAQGKYTLRMEQTDILVYIGEPSPYSVDQEIYIELIPVSGSYINSGIWQIIIEPIDATTGEYFLYMPTSAIRTEQTRFFRPTPEVTLTIPSTAVKVITVGSYDLTYNAYADFSGRGFADNRRNNNIVAGGVVKPDLAAPGVDIIAPDIYGGYQMVTGSSFATPLVSGSAALLMEWGIVRGNDPYLYGAKVKAYLRAGAKPIRGETDYPNGRVGFGALCLEDSLPI
ncbi:MAG: S8 family serine peptidase, partial [Clostridium sp.]|nr:S8 family serine peptidase [Clostridium sp.]